MRKIKQSTAKNVMLLMVDSTDHVTGKTGLTLTITASKDGAAFASITPTVTERGSGWYNLALTTAHTNTLGDLALHVTGTAADPADIVLLVEAGATDADVSSRSTFAGGAVASVTAAVTLPSIPANWITAAGITAAALNGKGDWNIGKTGYALTVTPPTAAQVRTEIDSNSTKLDVAVSTRMATFSYTAPDNAGVTAIKAKTDQLVFTVANQVDSNALSGGGSGLDAAGVRSAIGMSSANMDTQLSGINGKLPALVGGRVDASVGAMAANVITAAAINTAALNGKGDWNVGKTGYTLTVTPPTAANVADAVWSKVLP
jgi:hypothetical protein